MAKAPAQTLVTTLSASTSGSITLTRGIGKIIWNRQVVRDTEVLKISCGRSSIATINFHTGAEHYTYTFSTTSGPVMNILNFAWFTDSSAASAAASVNFSGLPAGSRITISFDLKGYIISNLTIVLGTTEYTWNQIYEPIVILKDMDPDFAGDDPNQAIISAGEDGQGDYWSRWYRNDDIEYFVCWQISNYPSQEYPDGKAIRHADLTTNTSLESI